MPLRLLMPARRRRRLTRNPQLLQPRPPRSLRPALAIPAVRPLLTIRSLQPLATRSLQRRAMPPRRRRPLTPPAPPRVTGRAPLPRATDNQPHPRAMGSRPRKATGRHPRATARHLKTMASRPGRATARAPHSTLHQAPLRPQRAMRSRQPQGMHSQRRRAMLLRRRRPLTPPAHPKATGRAPRPRAMGSLRTTGRAPHPRVTASRATGNRPRKATANPRDTTRALRKPMGKALSSRCSPVTPRKQPWPQLTATRRTPLRPLPRPLHRTRFRRPPHKKPCRRPPRSLRKRRFRPQLRTMTLPLPRFMTRIASQTSSPALAGTTSLMAAN